MNQVLAVCILYYTCQRLIVSNKCTKETCLPSFAAYSSRVAVDRQGVNVVNVSVCVDHSSSVVSSLVAMVTSKRIFSSVRFSVTFLNAFSL